MSEPPDEPLPKLPPPPRPLTARARWRSFGELPVRVWLVVTLALAAAGVFVIVQRLQEALPERWLLQNGQLIQARFIGVTGDEYRVGKHIPRNEPLTVRLSYSISGKTIEQSVLLDASPGKYAEFGKELAIRVDPNDPDRWAEDAPLKPWTHELFTSLMLALLLIILAIITMFRRRQMLRVWTDQLPAQATVVDVKQSATAPRSRIVRFTMNESDDRRIYRVLSPVRIGIPQRGQSLWIICPPNNPGRALVAAAYLDDSDPQR